MTRNPPRLAALLVLLALAACGPKEETGPVDVRWDRDVCERCRMAVSDRFYSAEVRGGPATERTKVHLFDDLGCAVLWLDEQDWKEDPRTEVWVTDCESGAWLDARRCAYLGGRRTPMDFGLGARPAAAAAAADSALDWDAASAHVRRRMVEKKLKKDSCCDGEPGFLKKKAGE